jgi:hypothetical protein
MVPDPSAKAPAAAVDLPAPFPRARGLRLGSFQRCPWAVAAAVGLVLSLAASAVAAGGEKLAQGPQLQIKVPATIVVEPATQANLPIVVGPEASLPRNSFIQLRGLPPPIAVSDGYSIGPGSWSVPLFALPSLRLNVPSSLTGRSQIVVTLVTADGIVLAEASASLVIAPAAGSAGALARPPSAAVQSLPAGEIERAKKIIAQGERYLSMGNYPVARQFFVRAADIGYAPAALRLGATYDPLELARLEVRGIVPDLAEARKWYERARDLGAAEATERLARLANN